MSYIVVKKAERDPNGKEYDGLSSLLFLSLISKIPTEHGRVLSNL
jgi:hypothetical protein